MKAVKKEKERGSDPAQCMFQNLIGEMAKDDIEWIYKYSGHLASTRIYDPSLKCTRNAEHDEIPWPTIYAVQRFHPKHKWLRTQTLFAWRIWSLST